MGSLRGLLWNIKGFHNTAKHPNKTASILFAAKSTNADFAVFTETHIAEDDNPIQWSNACHAYSDRRSSFRGIAVVPLKNGVTVDKVKCSKGRLLATRICVPGSRPVHVLAVYAPTNESKRASFMHALGEAAKGSELVVGDFNCVEDPRDKSGDWRLTQSAHNLTSVMAELELDDVLPPGSPHTWHGHGNTSSRIDRIYATESPEFSVAAVTGSSIGLEFLCHNISYSRIQKKK